MSVRAIESAYFYKFDSNIFGNTAEVQAVTDFIKTNINVESKYFAASGMDIILPGLKQIFDLAQEKQHEYIDLCDNFCNILSKLLRDVGVTEDICVIKNELETVLNAICNLGCDNSLARELIFAFNGVCTAFLLAKSCHLNVVIIGNNSQNDRIKTLLSLLGIEVVQQYAKTCLVLDSSISLGKLQYSEVEFVSKSGFKNIKLFTREGGIRSVEEIFIDGADMIRELSYNELLEMAYCNESIISQKTAWIAKQKDLEIEVSSIRNSTKDLTIIKSASSASHQSNNIVKAIRTITDVCVITLTSDFISGSKGFAGEFLSIFKHANVNILAFLQSVSERSISVIIQNEDYGIMQNYISDNMSSIIAMNHGEIEYHRDVSIISVIGDGMANIPGVASKIFKSFASTGVSIRIITQNIAENNIAIVVNKLDVQQAIKMMYDSYFKKLKTISLLLFGVGNIGGGFLKIVHSQQQKLLQIGIKLNLCLAANSTQYLYHKNGIDPSNMTNFAFNNEMSDYANPKSLVEMVMQNKIPNPIIVDLTSSQEIADGYIDFIRKNCSIVTANKKANTIEINKYHELHAEVKRHDAKFMYETNVGAGLPIISTLNDLIISGDKILEIEGVFSGTLSWLFNNFDGQKDFSSFVREAYNAGYTEPNPLDDLSGMDVARKLLILARICGAESNLEDIMLDNMACVLDSKIASESIPSAKAEDFWEMLKVIDKDMNARYIAAKTEGRVLRYIAKYDSAMPKGQELTVKIAEVPLSHSFANISHTDNIISIKTQHYNKTPMVICGPGAGVDVTAMGVFADVVKVANQM